MEPTPPRDPYGLPVSGLPEARRDAWHERQVNAARRNYLRALLDEVYQAILQRDVYADVRVTFRVMNGMLQPDIDVGVVRHHRTPPEE